MAGMGRRGGQCRPHSQSYRVRLDRVPGMTAFSPCARARTRAHTSGVTSALPPPVPCVSLTGQRPRVLNHGQIGHSQWEARRTEGGDTAIKAISIELARQTKAQLIGAEQTSLLWALFCSPLRCDVGQGTYVDMCAPWESLNVQDSWQGRLLMPSHETNLQMGTVTARVKWREERSWFLPRSFGLEQTIPLPPSWGKQCILKKHCTGVLPYVLGPPLSSPGVSVYPPLQWG